MAQLNNFRVSTGVTFPLLLNGSSLLTSYGDYDNYVVINKQGIIRYLAYDLWPHGNRYHLAQIRGAVDSLVTNSVAVEDGVGLADGRLAVRPNPFRGATTIEFSNPAAQTLDARVTVHDISGRRVATLWSGPAGRGTQRIAWDGRGEDGSPVAPGIYLVRSELGGQRFTQRIVSLR